MYSPNYRKKRKKRNKKLSRRTKKVLLVFLTVLVFVGAGIGVYEFLVTAGKKSLKSNSTTTAPDLQQSKAVEAEEEQQESYDPTVFHYKGEIYKYNENITTILCMGIDTREENFQKKENTGDSGQADTIFLLVLDPRENKMKLIGTSRDTMVAMENYDLAGNPIGETENHLGLAYAYGDGEEESCELMEQAVSKLFYDLPIHGYVSVLMSSIPSLNDAVGGVPVTVLEDLTFWDSALAKDAQLTLTGQQAYYYTTRRNTEIDGSNNLRMERQKQYALSYIQQAKAAVKANPSLPITIYNDLSSKMITNIGLDNAVYLASQMLGMEFDVNDIYMVEGETRTDQGVYEEFHVDDDKLLQLVLDIFYIKS